eukprot:TRINITY_DN46122_c0_g1_i2.p4 TRINITY_DN46122_c0_g1~~TRINITY_DN46122_c0_g1_i2.p4  ORF type:complete len:138 (-),score=8.45 TRINITY_DN46122_c0_g1_i2:1100-1513(-)
MQSRTFTQPLPMLDHRERPPVELLAVPSTPPPTLPSPLTDIFLPPPPPPPLPVVPIVIPIPGVPENQQRAVSVSAETLALLEPFVQRIVRGHWVALWICGTCETFVVKRCPDKDRFVRTMHFGLPMLNPNLPPLFPE